MPRFIFVARDNTGKKITGVEEAPSTDELTSRLQARNLLVVSIAPEALASAPISKQKGSQIRLKLRHYRVTHDDLVLFCRQLGTLLGAGVTIMKSLEIISQQVSSRKFYDVLQDLGKDMERGLSLHKAMARYPTVFSELWVNLAESGEASGNLAVVLDRLAGYLERNAAFKRKIISSLLYPAILMLAGLAALLFLTMKIIPTFAQLFAGFNVKLPLLTQILILISNFIRKYLFFMLGLSLIGFFIFKKYTRTNEGRRKFEQFQFNLPIFGEFFRALIVERFASGMSTLIESGVPLLYSLEITEHSVGNLIMADIIRQVKEDVRQGRPLNTTLVKSEFFGPMVVQMVAIGEEIGELPQMFKRINNFYQEYVETFLARLTTMFEPIMLIFLGAIIGTIVIGMFLPIFQIAQIK